MAHFFVSLADSPRSRYETAREAQISQFGRSETANRAIFALSAAQRGPCRSHRPIVRAWASVCDVGLTAARSLSASALAPRYNHTLSTLVLGSARPETRKTKATSGSSVVELTKRCFAGYCPDCPGRRHACKVRLRQACGRATCKNQTGKPHCGGPGGPAHLRRP